MNKKLRLDSLGEQPLGQPARLGRLRRGLGLFTKWSPRYLKFRKQ